MADQIDLREGEEPSEKKSVELPDEAVADAKLQPHPSTGDGAKVEENRKAPTMEVREVKPDPPPIRQLLFHDAHRLATMPRQKYDDFANTAFWSAVVTATSGLAGLYDILSNQPAQPKSLDIAEILIFGICVSLWIVGSRNRGNIETAEEYLNKLYRVDVMDKPEKHKLLRAWAILWRG